MSAQLTANFHAILASVLSLMSWNLNLPELLAVASLSSFQDKYSPSCVCRGLSFGSLVPPLDCQCTGVQVPELIELYHIHIWNCTEVASTTSLPNAFYLLPTMMLTKFFPVSVAHLGIKFPSVGHSLDSVIWGHMLVFRSWLYILYPGKYVSICFTCIFFKPHLLCGLYLFFASSCM